MQRVVDPSFRRRDIELVLSGAENSWNPYG
jgi:hypothetical protein